MTTGRMEAFSDAVIAIAITIMVLELQVPRGADATAWSTIHPLISVFFSYVLSFVILGIYWSNHHHLLQATDHVTGAILWANLHLLFWLSLFPFFTGWMGENNFSKLPTASYSAVLLLAAIGYYLLQRTIIREHGPESTVARSVGRDFKGKLSPVAFASAIPLAFVNRWIAVGIFAGVAVVWFVPDRRIELVLRNADSGSGAERS